MLRSFTRLLAVCSTRRRPPSKTVAIVVPLSDRPHLLPDEQTSLRHLRQFLGRYDTYLIAPRGSPVNIPGLKMKYFARKYFGSAAAHNLLMYSPALYRAFGDYKYIFFYHLDSLVFSDQLVPWCNAGLDYIGPPWIRCAGTPWITRPRVGNGGFTLLRVEAALKVLRARHLVDPLTFWLDLLTRCGPRAELLVRLCRRLQRRFPRSKILSRTVAEWEQMRAPSSSNRNNDIFWSDKAVRYLPSFKVASVEQGLQFAFEASPRTCLELNGGRMPFGCHAWARYDRAFWEPFLLDAPGSPRLAHSGSPAAATA